MQRSQNIHIYREREIERFRKSFSEWPLCDLTRFLIQFMVLLSGNTFLGWGQFLRCFGEALLDFAYYVKSLGSSTCALTGFFWLLSHVIYLKLTKVRMFSFPNWVISSKSSFSFSQAWDLNFLKTKFCQSSQIYLSPEKTDHFSSLELF